ncbi:MAG: hypothetical protein M1829_001099 [Trizodia sp. TS-e1964]|nr:MAG: hypothetical protein M1829_001099 [Trizodia sp. TS-e1964]
MSLSTPLPAVAMLPSGPSVAFENSAFFSRNAGCSLPSPANVRAHQLPGCFGPVCFEALNLLVKYGEEVTIAEGQCLGTLRRLLPGNVPVPEVYGWCHDAGQVFNYMELVQGVTLETRKIQKIFFLVIAHRATANSNKTKPEADSLAGHINRQPLMDIVFTRDTKSPAGPYASVAEFHDWLCWITKRGKEIHLHPSNIMVSARGPCRIVALIDWHQSGWYPHYWEYCKAVFTAGPNG